MPKIIELSGVVGYEITAKGLKNRIDKKVENIIKLDSVGGSVFEGNRLYNLLTDLMSEKVNISFELGAIAASAASYFPLAVGVENIRVRENTTFMGHKAWSFAIGNADDMKAEAEILDGFDRLIAKVYAKALNKTVDEMLEAMKNEFWLIGGQAIIEAGFASSIIESSDTENIIEKSEIVAMIKEAKNKLQEIVEQEDLNKWAAKLEIKKTDNTVTENQLNLFNNLPLSGEKNKPEDSNMNLTEYLNSNPEAKAVYEKIINSAKTEGTEEAVKNAVKEDRERTAEIVALFGTSEMALNAIKEGKDVKDLALEEKKAAIEKKENAEVPDMGGVTGKNQLPEKANSEESKKDIVKNSVSEYLKKTGGKK